MKQTITAFTAALTIAFVSATSGCVIAPREGDYDHDHHRYYHEHTWHECGSPDEHCR